MSTPRALKKGKVQGHDDTERETEGSRGDRARKRAETSGVEAEKEGGGGMKWYIVITTNIGTIDCGEFGHYYKRKSDAEADAERARKLPDTVKVEVKKK